MAAPDLAAIRAAIAAVLRDHVAGVTRVEPYEARAFPSGGVVASIWLDAITRPAVGQPERQLRDDDFVLRWIVRVWHPLRNEAAAQRRHETLASAIRDAFDARPLLDPNGPGVVDAIKVEQIVPLLAEGLETPLFLTEATLVAEVHAS